VTGCYILLRSQNFLLTFIGSHWPAAQELLQGQLFKQNRALARARTMVATVYFLEEVNGRVQREDASRQLSRSRSIRSTAVATHAEFATTLPLL
jgi:hypothetical protein